MFIGLIEFNRLLNIRSYIRKVGGKMVRVKSHKKQAVLRAHDAAEELLRLNKIEKKIMDEGIERGYLMPLQSGKVSQLHIGDASSVRIPRSQTLDSLYLHNHPNSAFPSPVDILTTGGKSRQGSFSSMTPYGSYHARFYKINDIDTQYLEERVNFIDSIFNLTGRLGKSEKGFRVLYRTDPNIFYREYGEAKRTLQVLDLPEFKDGTRLSNAFIRDLWDAQPYLNITYPRESAAMVKAIKSELRKKSAARDKHKNIWKDHLELLT